MEQEYFAIRNATTLYDLPPMVKYRVAGPAALPYLNRLVTRDVAKLKPDRVAYCVWCNDAGHLIDDGTIFRLGEDEYRICTAERQIDWLLDYDIGFDLEIGKVTNNIEEQLLKRLDVLLLEERTLLYIILLLSEQELGLLEQGGEPL